MQYMLLLFQDETRWATFSPEVAEREMGAYIAYTQALNEAGIMVAGDPVQPTTTATTVTVAADGKTSVLDGPYAETKEQLGGYYIIEVPDLDAAIAWAARCPGASHGTIRVRPIGAVPSPV
jgi:hypothetical protein